MIDLDPHTLKRLWRHVADTIATYDRTARGARVTPPCDPAEVRAVLADMTFEEPLDPFEAVDFAVENLWSRQIHVSHPGYFGLFNPAPTPLSVCGDALAAAFNPQLATWNHSPFATQVERHLIEAFGRRFGYPADRIDGTFASGGSEANQTAVLTALARHFPAYRTGGLRGLAHQPILYGSTESHHSFVRAARAAGLGTDALRQITVDDDLRMRPELLEERIAADRAAGRAPFMAVATIGTTNAGTVDPVAAVGEVCRRHGLWFHVDAAWGGAAVLLPELQALFAGCRAADSITFDAHKWLSVPMGAGLYLTRHPDVLRETFSIDTDYLRTDADAMAVKDPFTHSMQCSRRFTGLKVFLSLATAGWEGYRRLIGHQVAMGDLLRDKLTAAGWRIVNRTRLPLVCFQDHDLPPKHAAGFNDAVARAVLASGKAWISTTKLDRRVPVLRACITNYRTQAQDIEDLVALLDRVRAGVAGSSS